MLTLVGEDDSHSYKRKYSKERISRSVTLAKSRERQQGHFSVNRFALNYFTLLETQQDFNFFTI